MNEEEQRVPDEEFRLSWLTCSVCGLSGYIFTVDDGPPVCGGCAREREE